MTRIQAFFLTVGIVMILYGVAGKSWLTGKEGGPDGTGLAQEQPDRGGSQEPGFAELPRSRRTNGADPRETEAPFAGKTGRASGRILAVTLLLKDAETERPCAGALVELWRTASGTGPGFRTGRKLSGPNGIPADSGGRVTLSIQRGESVEIIARTKDDGPRERHVLGALDVAPPEPIEIRLRRPATPLEVRVTDSAGRPIPGVSIRIVSKEARPGADYPRKGTLGSRTDGNGKSVLSGKVRDARWLLLDAPDYSPQAVSLAGLQADARIDAALPEEATLELDVVDNAGNALAGAVVEVGFSLAGFTTSRTAMTDKRGHVTMDRLPADTPLRPVVTPKEGLRQAAPALDSAPGEVLRATLHVVQ